MTRGDSELAAALRILSAQGWFSGRSKAIRARLSAIAKLRSFAKNERIYLAGDPPNGIFGLVSGSLNISYSQGDGEDYTSTGRSRILVGRSCAVLRPAPARNRTRGGADGHGASPSPGSPFKSQVFGAGPILTYTIGEPTNPLTVIVKYYKEFEARNTFEGEIFDAGVTFKF